MKRYPNNDAAPRRNSAIRFIACALGTWIFLGNYGFGAIADAGEYSKGRAALRSGDYAGARQYFEAAINNKNKLEESQAGLLRMLRETGAFQEAADRADKFLSANNSSALLHLERGRIAKDIGDYDGAEKHLRHAVSVAPRGLPLHMDSVRLLAELLEETGRRHDAEQLWNQLINRYRAGPVQGSRSLGNIAVAAWRRGYVHDAKDIFMDATDPKFGEVSLEALAYFGYLFLEKYNFTDAMEVFKDCLKINKFYPDALIGMALAKKYDNALEAEAYATAALKANPNFVPALNSLAELAIEEEQYDEALQIIRSALAINPANLETLSLQAVCYYILGNSSGFTETEKKILGINPVYGKFYHILAENLASRRKYQEAVDFNRRAIALDPELWGAYASLGMNLTRVGELEEGRKAIQKAFDGDPFNVWAYNSLDLFDLMDTFVQSGSEHFRFRMSKEDADVLSYYATALSEEVYEKLTRRYGFEPEGPLQIEIFPDRGGFGVRTLGLPGLEGALGVCFGKVFVLDSPLARKAGSFNWGSTLWHEFTHVITLQMTNHNIPRWFSEGLSVHEEHRARPGWGDALTSSFINAYKEGRLLKASELNSGFVRPKNPEQVSLSYYQAGLVCEWIEEAFGFDKITQSLRLFAENKPAEEVFFRALGLTTEQMDAEYARFIDSRIKNIAPYVIFKGPEAEGESGIQTPPDRNELTRLLKNNPEDFFANLRMGVFLKKDGAYADAEPYLKKAKRLFPQYVEPGNPYQLLGQMYIEMKRENDALAEFKEWSQRDCRSLEPLIMAANIYSSRTDYDSAFKMLTLSIFIDPHDHDIQKKLVEAAIGSQQWTAAIAAGRVRIASDKSDPAGAHYDLARALLEAGKRLDAKRETLRALEIAPGFSKAQQLLLRLSESQ